MKDSLDRTVQLYVDASTMKFAILLLVFVHPVSAHQGGAAIIAVKVGIIMNNIYTD